MTDTIPRGADPQARFARPLSSIATPTRATSVTSTSCASATPSAQANVLLVEYPATALPGQPLRAQRRQARHDRALSRLRAKCKPESIILFGRSLCVASRCGRRSSANAWAASSYTRRSSPSRRLASLPARRRQHHHRSLGQPKPLAAVACRTLIIHGASDEVVPFAHAEALRDAQGERLHVTFFPTQGTHNYFSYYRITSVRLRILSGHASSRARHRSAAPRAVFTRAGARDHGAASESNDGDDVVVVVRIGRGDGVDGGRSGREGGFPPISTLVDGAGPASDPTTSEEDEPAEETKGRGDGGGGPSQGEVVPRRGRRHGYRRRGADAGAAGGDRRWTTTTS